MMLRVRIRWDMRYIDREVLKVIQGQPNLTQLQMAVLLGCHERTVIRSINRLREAGFLMVTGGGYRNRPNEYVINYEPLDDDFRRQLQSAN